MKQAEKRTEEDLIHKINMIEAILYIAERPVKRIELAEHLNISENEVTHLVEQLRARYEERDAPYLLQYDSKGYFLKLQPDIQRVLKLSVEREELPRDLIQVLAYIIFQQYVNNKTVTLTDLKKVFGSRTKKKLQDLEKLELLQLESEGKKLIPHITKKTLELLNLPNEPEDIKAFLESGLKSYIYKMLQ